MIVLDSNVIIYALDASDVAKGEIGARLLDHVVGRKAITPRQVLCELLNQAHKKRGTPLMQARKTVRLLEEATHVVDTDQVISTSASELAERFQLQYFDAVICTVARRGGASILFTEDMRDGFKLGTMTIVNPFVEANAAIVEQALST